MLDLVVRGGHVVTPGGVVRADVGVGDGVIAEVAPELDGARVIDAAGLHVFPGGLDPHVHFNEPGRTHWEGHHRPGARRWPRAASARSSTCR